MALFLFLGSVSSPSSQDALGETEVPVDCRRMASTLALEAVTHGSAHVGSFVSGTFL